MASTRQLAPEHPHPQFVILIPPQKGVILNQPEQATLTQDPHLHPASKTISSWLLTAWWKQHGMTVVSIMSRCCLRIPLPPNGPLNFSARPCACRWISSMTGGTEKAGVINRNLARLANEFGLGMGLGSCRNLLYSDEYLADFAPAL